MEDTKQNVQGTAWEILRSFVSVSVRKRVCVRMESQVMGAPL